MKLNRRKPDYEAESVSIEADTITDPEKFRRSNDHQANRITAEGDVEIRTASNTRGQRTSPSARRRDPL